MLPLIVNRIIDSVLLKNYLLEQIQLKGEWEVVIP